MADPTTMGAAGVGGAIEGKRDAIAECRRRRPNSARARNPAGRLSSVRSVSDRRLAARAQVPDRPTSAAPQLQTRTPQCLCRSVHLV